ncbi:hypothetical protein HYS92_00140 [Candidatus Daviesbacteria bacterium]|nr:hypothetical protein [Candidatus Daviesbacteria bacterium]
MQSKSKDFQVVYQFDPVAIPNWQERLASAFEILFKKIDELEDRGLRGLKGKGEDYGEYTTP